MLSIGGEGIGLRWTPLTSAGMAGTIFTPQVALFT